MMILYGSAASPYARLARVFMLEKGLEDRFSWVEIDSMSDPEPLARANPLMQVPTLVFDDGSAIFDSEAICAYADTLAEPKLLPNGGKIGAASLRRRTLARGVLDAAVRTVQENRRPESERSSLWLARWARAIERAFAAIDVELADAPAADDFSMLAAVVAAEYIGFRMPSVAWRNAAPKLAAATDALKDRPSIAKTRPR